MEIRRVEYRQVLVQVHFCPFFPLVTHCCLLLRRSKDNSATRVKAKLTIWTKSNDNHNTVFFLHLVHIKNDPSIIHNSEESY